ncbi:hypothetical protein FHEFKHOI_00196 [Candidatus Methanoperedenaceae archaeon GB50]|nr:hypothetical protein AIOGIFDO_00195 [Candidatus Methanoperedenaceae archaeon GB37]CAD7768304.1 hypothetical protein FHEFKHOI_00196 [Candidatus Methanoperedenaceae archaeon GB50]CAD7774495.1 MAG: hypothetical protein KBONHNOK_00721 [Candidatus Methanoperedenaceae archaeon GB50]
MGKKKREIVKQRLRKLPEYVRDAVSNLNIEKKAGRPEQSRRDHTTLQRKTVLIEAMKMIKNTGIRINSISLNKHYSTRKTSNLFDKETAVYMIPNDWLRIIKKTTETPYQILKRYSKRKSNKSTFSADKRRFN